jgi:hypothetical protein
MESNDARASVAAATALLNRGWGQPAQAVTGPDGEALAFPTAITFIVTQASEAQNRT